MDTKHHTFRRYKDGNTAHSSWQNEIIEQDSSYKCPTCVHRTPPCQGACPSGEDIRGWLDIVRGLEKPPSDLPWQEYAFRRSTDANPFPSVMGRVCPAPCQDGCNRNEIEGFVGINSVEQFIGDYALSKKLSLGSAGKETGKRVAIIGGGVAGLACACQLRRRGHGCTIFEAHEMLGGMMRYGIPGYRTPRDVLDGEIQRIVDMGVDVRLNTRIGIDVSVEQLEREFDAVFIAIGAQSGRPLPIPNADAPNCITGVAFLDAFNQGRLRYTAENVVVVGGGDTAMDVVSVARRLGHIKSTHEKDRTEYIVLGHYEERFKGLSEGEVQAEAERCMSCGMCFECDNCVIYCPQDAVKRTPPEQATTGRYVYTDYNSCIGCHICSEVCPTGYINMGLGDGLEL